MPIDPRVIQEMRSRAALYSATQVESMRLAQNHQAQADRFTAEATSAAGIVAAIHSALAALGETP